MKISNVLDTESNWIKHTYCSAFSNSNCRYCLMGAVHQCIGDDSGMYSCPTEKKMKEKYTKLVNKLYNAIPKRFQKAQTQQQKTAYIISYNDNKNTTWKSIQNTLKRAGL